MSFLRNPEIKRTLLLYVAVCIAATACAFALSLSFGLFTLALCSVLMLIYFLSTYKRYKRIAALAADIDRILHNEGHISIEKYSEGELALLQSEIYKMTVKLREQKQALQNDKIYLSNSIADISHQIRTPLTSINLLVPLIANSDTTDERRQKLSCELYELLSGIEWLITALLKISKLDAGTVEFTKQQIKLDDLIEKAVAPLWVPLDLRNQRLEISALGELCCDPYWTGEALVNIVKNCMEHTPEDGKIEIKAQENALYSEITVSDSGSGILPEDLPHIFERFYKGKNSDEKSFGIGLALSRMIITSQNGTVKAENLPEGGARFTIRFYKGTV